MGQAFYKNFERCMSPSRSHDYSSATNRTNHEITSSYQFNVMLCEALYPSLNLMEVSLRNAIHDHFKVSFDSDRWFEDTSLMDAAETQKVVDAKSNIARRGKAETTDRLVAELSLGFWVALFKRNYDNKFWHNKNAFTGIFPRMSRPDRNRKTAYDKLEIVRNLRNSVFHHDNLLKDPNLSMKYQAIYRILYWIEPDLASFSKNFDRYPNVFANGLNEAKLCQMNIFYTPACIV